MDNGGYATSRGAYDRLTTRAKLTCGGLTSVDKVHHLMRRKSVAAPALMAQLMTRAFS